VVRWKNWHLVLRGLATLANPERKRVRFDHWGLTPADTDSAQYAEELQQFVRQHDLAGQVTFHGATDEVAACLRSADWFLLPSTNEPCSVALIEALALGIPALVSASGGNVDIVTPGRNGLLFTPDDETDLTARLGQVLRASVPPSAPAMIRETVRSRSAACVAAQYTALYQQLMERDGTVSPDRAR
jgi:glycosyltransferase involved in cell wall biosynthesis